MTKSTAPKKKNNAAAQTTLIPVEGRVIRPVPLAEIQPDTRQPRTDDEKKAANVANICDTLLVDSAGTSHPLAPIQIRRTPPWSEDQERPWMIFDGECRYLASTIKGAVAIDADVIEIPEANVFEAQVLTAMARDGLGPQALMDAVRKFDADHIDVTAKDAAARLGMRTEVVRSLRKLNGLPPDVRLRYMGGEHTLEVCDAIARIEGLTPEEKAERQSQASKAVAAMAPRKAREYIASTFLLRLETAPFDREDATLNQEAGVCSACPFRSGAQASLFGETDKAEDCCTKPACWMIKADATAAKNPKPADEQKTPKKDSGKPTQQDVTIAAAVAGGHGAEDLDAMFSTMTREEIDASLEKLTRLGNPKTGTILQDRRAKGKDIGGYSCGSAHAIAAVALDGVRDAVGRLTAPDAALFLRGVIAVTGGFLTFIEPGAPTSDIACEPGGEPPPPPPLVEHMPDDEDSPFVDDFEPSASRESAFAGSESEMLRDSAAEDEPLDMDVEDEDLEP